MSEKLLEVNFEVLETWHMECPHCYREQDAPFNEASPMSPMKVRCENSNCDKEFILTYERD